MAYVEQDIPAPLSTEYKEVAWAVPKFGQPHRPIWINRPNVSDHQIKLEVLYCGTCTPLIRISPPKIIQTCYIYNFKVYAILIALLVKMNWAGVIIRLLADMNF